MTKRTDKENNNLAIGLALGLTFGAATSSLTGNWGLVGVGLCVGVALGLTVDFSDKIPRGDKSKRKKKK